MAIKVGDKLPEATFTTMTSEGPKPMSTADVFGGKKSHVSYYALLKDFVLEVTGGGRGNDMVIEKMVVEPPLIRLYNRWRARTANRGK